MLVQTTAQPIMIDPELQRSAVSYSFWGFPGIISPPCLCASLPVSLRVVWESQVVNAIPLGARARWLAFQHNKNGPDKASWFTQVAGLFQRGMEKEWVQWLTLIIIYLFGEISYLYMVCLVWINLGRHRMTVHNLTLTWVTGLWQRAGTLIDTAWRQGSVTAQLLHMLLWATDENWETLAGNGKGSRGNKYELWQKNWKGRGARLTRGTDASC